MRIVTSGFAFLDIDAYAGCVAYAELLNVLGQPAHAVSTAPWNESISSTVRTWDGSLVSQYMANPADTFTLIDISEAAFFDHIVDLARVDEIIDHHPGFEAEWKAKLGERAHIEFIGAACTLVYEHWKAAGKLDHLSLESSKLLATGILDNTLNFNARVSTPRDKQAYQDLVSRTDLTDAWPAAYFSECQAGILEDVARALANDAKIITYPGLADTLKVGQLAVWDTSELLATHIDTMRQVLSTGVSSWYLNLISLSEGKSYLLCDDSSLQTWLTKLLGAQFEGSIGTTGHAWLRKEIMKQAIEHPVN